MPALARRTAFITQSGFYTKKLSSSHTTAHIDPSLMDNDKYLQQLVHMQGFHFLGG